MCIILVTYWKFIFEYNDLYLFNESNFVRFNNPIQRNIYDDRLLFNIYDEVRIILNIFSWFLLYFFFQLWTFLSWNNPRLSRDVQSFW